MTWRLALKTRAKKDKGEKVEKVEKVEKKVKSRKHKGAAGTGECEGSSGQESGSGTERDHVAKAGGSWMPESSGVRELSPSLGGSAP